MSSKTKIGLLFLTFIIAYSCKDKPVAPVFNNPLDRRNPDTNGDPFELQANLSIAEGGVKLQWTDIDISTINGYNVYRSESETGGFVKIGNVAASENNYLDRIVKNDHSYWYKVTAFTYNGEESDQTNIQSVKIKVTGIPNRAPIASFTVTPDSGNLQTEFSFDASASSDYEDDIVLLQVRWDWENDGVWDTDYSTIKAAQHQYAISGTKTVKMGVIDTGNLTDISTQQVTVIDIPTSVKDIDGNIYKIVKIGSQWWTAENLKVTRYRNGDAIPNVTNATAWSNLTTGAYCDYDNNSGNVSTYGRLYNWYAVSDGRCIAPAGWHVPRDEEWKMLEKYLGMSQSDADNVGLRGTDEGGKIKVTGTAHWQSPNTGATNESGFSALPGGYREANGHYYDIVIGAYFWSSTEYVPSSWNRRLYNNSSAINRGWLTKPNGVSVRCIRD